MVDIRDPNALTGPVTADESLAIGGKATDEELQAIADPSWWDSVKEILPSIGSGVRLNVSSYPGAAGDISDLVSAGERLTSKWGGASPEELQRQREADARNRVLPNTEDVNTALATLATNAPAAFSADSGLGAVEAAVAPVEPWHPKTGLGKGIETITSMIGPGALSHIGRDIIAPLIGSEVGAKVGEQLGPEEAQLLSATGGLAGGPLDEAAKQVATRTFRGPRNPEAATTMRTLQGTDVPLTQEAPNARDERMRRLAEEGVDVTGGQALGSEMVKRLEAGPYSTKGGAINEQQARQLTAAALRSAGINADVASPEVMSAAQNQFGADYQDLIRQNNGIVMDPALQNELVDIGTRFEDLKGTAAGTAVEKFFDRIVNSAAQHGGVIPPDVFNVIHSELAATIRSASKSPELSTMAEALRGMQDALYDTMGRNGQPDVQAAAQDLNNRYRNFKIIEKSVGGAGEEVSFGLVSPGKLRAELERRDPSGYAQGRGDLTQLARDAQSLTPMPVSGTGAQLASSGLSGLATTMAVNMPLSGVLTSRPVRTAIVRRATGEHQAFTNPMRLPPIIGMSQQGMLPMPVDAAPASVNPDAVFAPTPPAPDKQSLLENDYPVPVDLVDPADVLRRRGLRYG
jgi:hypothetical protein